MKTLSMHRLIYLIKDINKIDRTATYFYDHAKKYAEQIKEQTGKAYIITKELKTNKVIKEEVFL